MHFGKDFSVLRHVLLIQRTYNNCGEAPCPHPPPTHVVKRVRENLCMPSNPAWQYLLHWRRLGLRYSFSMHPINVPVKQTGEWVAPSSSTKEKKVEFSKSSLTMSSLDISHASTARNPKALTTAESHSFAALEEKDPAPSNNPPEATGTSTQGMDSGCSTNPSEWKRASSHPGEQGVNPSLPDLGEREKAK